MQLDINKLIQPTEAYVPESSDPIVQPYTYISETPSNNQNVRTRFLHAFNDLFYKISDESLLARISEIISVFHNSSLLIDDIEDDSKYRRGVPVAHVKYGIPTTINCGNLMYFVALQQAQQLSGPHGSMEVKFKSSQILIDELLNLHRGQGLDIYWRDYLKKLEKLPDVEEYLEMIKDKTGGLFRLAIKLLLLYSDVKENDQLVSLANLMGILYQVRDDYLNLVDAKYSAMKGTTCEDLIEGKLSLPILHCLRTTKDSPVHKILYDYDSSSDRVSQNSLIYLSLSFMKNESKSLEYTLNLIKVLEKKLRQLILTYPELENSALLKIVERLCDL